MDATSSLRLSRRRLIVASAATGAAAVVAGAVPALARPTPAAAAAPSAPPADNVQVSQDAFTGHIEPAIAVNPHDPRNLLAVSRVLQGTRLGLAGYASFDGGRSWRGYGLLPGVLPDYDANPVVTFDDRGRGFVCGLLADRQQQGHAAVWRTEDGGRTFAAPATAVDAFLDHPALAADPQPRTPSGRLYLAGTVYNAARNGLAFTRSTDSGASFEPPRFLDPVNGPYGLRPVIAAGPGGAVHILYTAIAADQTTSLVRVLTSTDRGATFADAVDLPVAIVSPPTPNQVITRCGPALAAASDGSLYAAIATYDPAAGRSQLLVCAAYDRGRTWGAPTTLADSTQTIYFEPSIATAPGGGVGVTAYALRADGTDVRVDVVLFTGGSRPAAFGPPLTVTTKAFDPTVGTGVGTAGGAPYWLGNYQGLAATGDAFHPVWTDTRTGGTQILTATIHP